MRMFYLTAGAGIFFSDYFSIFASMRFSFSLKENLTFYLKILLLNVPVIFFLLLRFFRDVPMDFLGRSYVYATILGYYFFLLFILLLPSFILSFLKKFSEILAFLVFSTMLLYFALDGIVYSVYKFHINYFFINLFFIDFENFGFAWGDIFFGIAVLLGTLGLELLIFKYAKRIPAKVLYFSLLCLLALVISQSIYVYALENSLTSIASLSARFPLYYPIESREWAEKQKELGAELKTGATQIKTLYYPKTGISLPRELNKDSLPNILFLVLESTRFDMLNDSVMPNIYNFSKRALVANRHYSTGNATVTGIFGMFYGLHPTYWQSVKEARTEIDNPVLIDLLKQAGYSFGIFSHSNLERFKLHSAIFNGIPVYEKFPGKNDWQQDKAMNDSLIKFLEQPRKKPFFAFAFYTSSHHSYFFPEEKAVFKPYRKINMATISNESPPLPYLNAYKNAIYYLDGLIGKVLETLQKTNPNTIVIITSDHGEEFNENRFNYWGHGSNFTCYQTQVPFILFFPGKKPRKLRKPSSHTDIVPTLLQEVFKISIPEETYASGKNLYGIPEEPRIFFVQSYVTYAIIMLQDVWEIRPLGMRKYNVCGIRIHAGKDKPELLKKAFEEMAWFYKK